MTPRHLPTVGSSGIPAHGDQRTKDAVRSCVQGRGGNTLWRRGGTRLFGECLDLKFGPSLGCTWAPTEKGRLPFSFLSSLGIEPRVGPYATLVEMTVGTCESCDRTRKNDDLKIDAFQISIVQNAVKRAATYCLRSTEQMSGCAKTYICLRAL